MLKILEIKENHKYVVAQFKTESGSTFEVGYPKDAGYSAETLEVNLDKFSPELVKEEEWITVHWEPGKEAFIPMILRKRKIESARINEDLGLFYAYRLNFVNSGGWKFYFKDLTGDVYSCKTILNGKHYIDYNSDNAVIVSVK